ncbi:MAG: acetylornithine/succinylornithine family transaminase [Phycisphaeraceae bacterium]
MSSTPQTQDIIARHDRFMSINYGRWPIAMVRGEGTMMWDADGKEYLDLFAGFGGSLLGHCHPDLVEAVTEQAKQLWFVGNLFHSDPQTRLAEQIARHGFGGRSFFCHSGADANEAAIKAARLYGGKHPGKQGPRFKIVTAQASFHGRTYATMSATGQPRVSQGFEPLVPGFTHVPYNDLAAVERAIDEQTVAVMFEPIQGEGGINVPGENYWPGLRKLCDERDVLLIADEVWTGGGRTGQWFAHQHWNIEPDVMTLAKGVGGGLPVGVTCMNDKVAAMVDYREHGAVAHATTLGGNLLSMAVAAAVFHVIERDDLVSRAATLGEHAVARLREVAERVPAIKAVRGRGLFIGVELDPNATGAWFSTAKDVVTKCLERGVLLNASQEKVLRFAPALIVRQDELDRGIDVLEDVLKG